MPQARSYDFLGSHTNKLLFMGCLGWRSRGIAIPPIRALGSGAAVAHFLGQIYVSLGFDTRIIFLDDESSAQVGAMQDLRKRQRLRVLKAGTISFGLGAGIDCVARNMSDTGASLEIESPIGIPDSFTLLIKADKTMRACRVIWRKARRIGVRFD